MQQAIEKLVGLFREDIEQDNSIDGADATDAVAEFVRAYIEQETRPKTLPPEVQALVDAAYRAVGSFETEGCDGCGTISVGAHAALMQAITPFPPPQFQPKATP